MRINGLWFLCDDGMIRPVINGEVLGADGTWLKAPFLVDTAADRTLLSADVLNSIQASTSSRPGQLQGAGGTFDSVLIESEIRLTQDNGVYAVFKGEYAACTNVATLDMTVLGRDILNLFTVIVDRQGDSICLIGLEHFYTIGQR